MPYCSSCGQEIPTGQGQSCSMCYGDPFWGKDGYYLQELEREYIAEVKRREQEDEDFKKKHKGEF